MEIETARSLFSEKEKGAIGVSILPVKLKVRSYEPEFYGDESRKTAYLRGESDFGSKDILQLNSGGFGEITFHQPEIKGNIEIPFNSPEEYRILMEEFSRTMLHGHERPLEIISFNLPEFASPQEGKFCGLETARKVSDLSKYILSGFSMVGDEKPFSEQVRIASDYSANCRMVCQIPRERELIYRDENTGLTVKADDK